MIRIASVCIPRIMLFYVLFHSKFNLTNCQSHPNIVLIITDDQDIFMDGMGPMVKTTALIKEKGVNFVNAFATSPVCCPSRSTILTGLYQHNHNVFNNTLQGGCSNETWQETLEKQTFAVKLQQQGYKTFYAGKYLNQYGDHQSGCYIPPGWDEWIGLVGNSKYYNYTLSINGEKKYFSNNYLTHVLKAYSAGFIRKASKHIPFLMVIAPPAPHEPFTPEPKYKGFFEGKQVPRTRQFNYGDNADKHWLMQMEPSPLPDNLVQKLDGIYSRRWETLLSVDDLIESSIFHLYKNELLKNTFIIFTSDHGYHLGQFSLAWDKRQMYEFDLRIPLLISGPGLPTNIDVSNPVILPDIAPTLLFLAGLNDKSIDGKSFLPIKEHMKRTFLVEYHGEGSHKPISGCPYDENLFNCSPETYCKCQDSRNNTYFCLRTMSKKIDFIYCQFSDGFEEAYDLKKDVYQLQNIAPMIEDQCKQKIIFVLNKLILCKGAHCSNVHNFSLNLNDDYEC